MDGAAPLVAQHEVLVEAPRTVDGVLVAVSLVEAFDGLEVRHRRIRLGTSDDRIDDRYVVVRLRLRGQLLCFDLDEALPLPFGGLAGDVAPSGLLVIARGRYGGAGSADDAPSQEAANPLLAYLAILRLSGRFALEPPSQSHGSIVT